jgi:hypothetical protein
MKPDNQTKTMEPKRAHYDEAKEQLANETR